MSTTLWDTNGSAVVSALLAERRHAGGSSGGLALSLVVVVDEAHVREAEVAATAAAAEHPCRLLVVVRRSLGADIRLDAEVQVGGRLGATEAVVMRMYGRLALHAESVVLPLLAADAPVVTWWHGPAPDEIATDALGVLADRRITDSAYEDNPVEALRHRAADFQPGDTDLAWTRSTPWRSLLASAFDAAGGKPQRASVSAEPGNPSAALVAGWLSSRLDIEASVVDSAGPGITAAEIVTVDDDGDEHVVTVDRPDGATATMIRDGDQSRSLQLPRREMGDLLAEELRRMDPDLVYAEALGEATGTTVDASTRSRSLVWRDPAWVAAHAESKEPVMPAETAPADAQESA